MRKVLVYLHFTDEGNDATAVIQFLCTTPPQGPGDHRPHTDLIRGLPLPLAPRIPAPPHSLPHRLPPLCPQRHPHCADLGAAPACSSDTHLVPTCSLDLFPGDIQASAHAPAPSARACWVFLTAVCIPEVTFCLWGVSSVGPRFLTQ